MKEFNYSRKLVNKASTILFIVMIGFSFVCFLYDYIFGFIWTGISIYTYIYSIHFNSQITQIQVYENYIIVHKRRYLFFVKKTKIEAEKGIYQYWELSHYRHIKKNYIYSLKKNTYLIFRITPSDYWEKETIEDLIVEVQRIGIPLKGNLSESIQVQKDKDCPSKNEENA